ncbi:MAG TPA: hypothetical protein VF490_03360 [Chryseosolibacter sp.]
MFVPFSSLPPSSRVWVFQASRPMAAKELEIAEHRLAVFTGEWAVHGTPLKTSFVIRYDQFIVLAADESDGTASGCSIDSSVRVLKEIGQSIGIDFFGRDQVAFKIGNKVQLIPLSQLKEKFSDGTLNGDSLTFNNLVDTKSAFDAHWLAPAADTWLKRYLPNVLVR